MLDIGHIRGFEILGQRFGSRSLGVECPPKPMVQALAVAWRCSGWWTRIRKVEICYRRGVRILNMLKTFFKHFKYFYGGRHDMTDSVNDMPCGLCLKGFERLLLTELTAKVICSARNSSNSHSTSDFIGLSSDCIVCSLQKVSDGLFGLLSGTSKPFCVAFCVAKPVPLNQPFAEFF